jgi:hypothetical protein
MGLEQEGKNKGWCSPPGTNQMGSYILRFLDQKITAVSCNQLNPDTTCKIRPNQTCIFNAEAAKEELPDVLTCELAAGNMSFDTITRKTITPYGESKLTPIEAIFLTKLMQEPGRVVSQRKLYEEIYPKQQFIPDSFRSSIIVPMARLRGKLEGPATARNGTDIAIIGGQRSQEGERNGGYYLITPERLPKA